MRQVFVIANKRQDKYMKMIISQLGLTLFLVASQSAACQGTLISLHSGYNDPTTEGFSLSLASASVGAVTNDLGMDAWSTSVPMNGLYAIYRESLTSEQTAQLSGQNWVLSLTLRVVADNTTGLSHVGVADATDLYNIFFGAGSDGDPFVEVGNQSYTLNGAGSSYNNYQLVFNSASDIADLWVNGVEQFYDVAHNHSPVPGLGFLRFSSGQQAGPAQVNWNLVSLTVPEPSPAALIVLGGGTLMYLRRKCRG